MRNLTSIVLLCVASFFAQAAPALAKINIGESIDWAVVDSDRIIMGTIEKIEELASDQRWEAVTVAIDKTFKGTPAERATFLVSPQWGPIAKSWRAEGKPMLFFLNNYEDKADPPSKFAWILREQRLNYSAVFLGNVNRDWVQTRTMRIFTRESTNQPMTS